MVCRGAVGGGLTHPPRWDDRLVTTSASRTPGRLHVEPADLRTAARLLDSTAGSLASVAPDLDGRPDAGASSDELATALGALARAVAAVADEVRDIATTTRATAVDLAATDQQVGDSMRWRPGDATP